MVEMGQKRELSLGSVVGRAFTTKCYQFLNDKHPRLKKTQSALWAISHQPDKFTDAT